MRAAWGALVAIVVSVAAAVPASASAPGTYGFLSNNDPPNVRTDGFTGAVFRNGPNDTTGIQTPDNYADLAGEHPETGVIRFGFQTDDLNTPDDGEPVGQTHDLRVEIPPGLVPDPTHFPHCTDDQLETPQTGVSNFTSTCPRGSQVGTQQITIKGNTSVGRKTIRVVLPVYNMTLKPGQLARFAFAPNDAPLAPYLTGDKSRIDILGGVRDTTDYGLFFTIKTPMDPAVVGAKLTFWNVPGDPKFNTTTNDANRDIPQRDQACTTVADGLGLPGGLGGLPLGPVCQNQGDNGALDPDQPFLTNPTACLGILNTRIFARPYQDLSNMSDFNTPRGAQDCPGVPFNPGASFGPNNPQSDSPTAFTVHLSVPQTDTGAVRGTSHVKRLTTTLPPGVTFNPSFGNSVQGCPDDQFPSGADVKSPVTCPERSRVGSATINTPLLPFPVQGTAYAGQPLPGNRYRLFIEASTPTPPDPSTPGAGTAVLRLKGTVTPDPRTGQLSATLDNLPQLPFDSADVTFDGGPFAVLASPQDCTATGGLVDFEPWAENGDVNAPASIQSVGCPSPAFAPAFSGLAGTTHSGAYSTVVARVARPDGQQFLQGAKVDLPPGLLAKTKGAKRCPASAAPTGRCSPSTRVGTASVRVGAGSSPLSLRGPVYFSGPYRGAPFSFVTVVHAIAGPYDLGNVVVRQAVRIDPKDAHVTVESDPLPQVVGGIPLRLRNIEFNVNKGKFVLNPTSCSTAPMRATLTSAPGLRAFPTQGLAFSRCQSLKFKPRLALSLTGDRDALRDGGHPGVLAKLRGSGSHGQANFKRVQVTLPKSLALDPTNAESLCEYAEAIKTDPKCPKGSVVGRATAKSGILDKTLSGKVFFAKRIRTNKFGRQIPTLPMLVVPLRGQGVKINLIGTTAVSGTSRLVTTFETPDAPVGAFDLRVEGGKHGILVANTKVCRRSRATGVVMRAQNGAKRTSNRAIAADGCKATKKTKTGK